MCLQNWSSEENKRLQWGLYLVWNLGVMDPDEKISVYPGKFPSYLFSFSRIRQICHSRQSVYIMHKLFYCSWISHHFGTCFHLQFLYIIRYINISLPPWPHPKIWGSRPPKPPGLTPMKERKSRWRLSSVPKCRSAVFQSVLLKGAQRSCIVSKDVYKPTGLTKAL